MTSFVRSAVIVDAVTAASAVPLNDGAIAPVVATSAAR